MGFISEFAQQGTKATTAFPGSRDGTRLWREVFGVTDKETGSPQPAPVPGGSYGRSSISSDNAVKRLIQAMRSMAPGGWSDDRFEQSRHFVGIQYICLHRTGMQLMQAEFQLFEEDDQHPDGKRPVTPDDPPQGNRIVRPYQLIDLLKKPNAQDSFGDLMYRWNQQMGLTGMALTWMVPNELGYPFELYPIPTAIAIPQPVINPEYPHGFYRIQPVYPYGPFSSYPTPNSAVGAPIPAQWMMRFLYPHPFLRYDGYSPQTALRLHLDEVEMIDRSRHSSMRRGIHPSAVLNMDGMDGAQPLPEPEILRIKSDFEETQMGPENFGQLFVAAPGSKLEEWGTRPIDMDYQAGWDQLVSFAMSGFGTTKAAAGMLDEVSYAALFASMKQQHLMTLQPLCDMFATKLTRHLGQFFGDKLIVEIRCARVDDPEVKKAKVETLIEAGAITKNEVRKEMDLTLTSEPWGEEIAGTISAEGQVSNALLKSKDTPALIDPDTGGVVSDRSVESKPEKENQEEPDEMIRDRPRPGPLGRGALGPRKHLNGQVK